MSGIHCCMVRGQSLSDGARNILFDTAQEMVRGGKERRKIKGEDFEGLVTTRGETAIMGSLAGIVFHAEVECEDGRRSNVTYLVRPADIRAEQGEWLTFREIAERYAREIAESN